MIPAPKTITPSAGTSSASPTAGTETPTTAFDAILSLETVAATTATQAAAGASFSLEGACLEGLADSELSDGDDSDLEDTEDGEAADALAFLADLLNVAAVTRQPAAGHAGGEPAANDDVLSGSADTSSETMPVGSTHTSAGKEASTDKLSGQAAQLAAQQAALVDAGVEAVDAARPTDESINVSRAADWVQGPRHAPAGPERSGIVTHARDPRWAEEFGTRIVLMVRGGESSASLQLSPVELGPMDVSVTIRDSQASIHFGAAQAETRALIEASIPRLREMLAAQGFQLADASVSQGFSRQTGGGVATTGRGAAEPEAEPQSATRIALNGLLDLYA